MNMYNNEVTEILIKANYPGLGDTKMWIEHDYDLVKPEELGGDGVKSFKESGHATQLIGDRKFLTPANNRVNIYEKPTRNYDSIPDSVWELWMDLLNTSNRYSDKELKEMNRIDELTLDEYKSELISAYNTEKNAVDFELTIVCDTRKPGLEYTFNLKTYSELRGQILASDTGFVAWHDDSKLSHDLVNPYSVKEASDIIYALELKIAEKDGTYDMMKERVNLLTEKVPRATIESIPLTEQELQYIGFIQAGIKKLVSE